MNGERLVGEQYVRLAPGAAERLAAYLDIGPEELLEVVLDLAVWPEAVRPNPRRGRSGLLIAGDPLLLDAGKEGLVLAGRTGQSERVLVRWEDVRGIRPLQPAATVC